VTKHARCWLVAFAPVALILLFLITADYGVSHGSDVRYVSRSPVATISWGPAHSYIIQKGINIVGDSGVGLPGNFVEFPISVDTRVSMRLFSFRWLRDYLHRRGVLANCRAA
jgi:hypothetical protein